jgi:hypothetical protein
MGTDSRLLQPSSCPGSMTAVSCECAEAGQVSADAPSPPRRFSCKDRACPRRTRVTPSVPANDAIGRMLADRIDACRLSLGMVVGNTEAGRWPVVRATYGAGLVPVFPLRNGVSPSRRCANHLRAGGRRPRSPADPASEQHRPNCRAYGAAMTRQKGRNSRASLMRMSVSGR